MPMLKNIHLRLNATESFINSFFPFIICNSVLKKYKTITKNCDHVVEIEKHAVKIFVAIWDDSLKY